MDTRNGTLSYGWPITVTDIDTRLDIIRRLFSTFFLFFSSFCFPLFFSALSGSWRRDEFSSMDKETVTGCIIFRFLFFCRSSVPWRYFVHELIVNGTWSLING